MIAWVYHNCKKSLILLIKYVCTRVARKGVCDGYSKIYFRHPLSQRDPHVNANRRRGCYCDVSVSYLAYLPS